MIGISLSLCIPEIASGVVSLDEIDYIIAGSACADDAAWDKLMLGYRATYWSENPHECERIVRQLLDEKRISQPRLQGGPPPIAGGGKPIWVRHKGEIKWATKF